MQEQKSSGEQHGLLKEIQERDIRPWMDLIDELRSHGIHHDVPLPQIAVMGDQSSGKSSVLEAISGVPFPRGAGLTTRCPVQLILKHLPDGAAWSGKASVAGRNVQPPGAGPLANPHQVADAIVRLTEAVTEGAAAAFSTETITVEIRAPSVPDLTLIDLPGIVRTATAGQSIQVIGQVNALIEHFLRQERTVILAVVPANQDIATIDILERAAEVDPEGRRTIGVLTKPDLVGAGNEGEVLAVAKNERKPLRLGYVMVRCRNQKELNEGVTSQQAAAREAAFFRNHPHFADIPPDLRGVRQLTPKLSNLLVERIKEALPFLKWELEEAAARAVEELHPLQRTAAPATPAAAGRALVGAAADYCRLLRQSARGLYRDALLAGSPALRLHLALRRVADTLRREVAATMPGFGDPGFLGKLEEEMARLRGREPPGFPNTAVFYGFMAQNVQTWRPAVERCCLRTFEAAHTVSALLAEALVPQFPNLCRALTRLAEEAIGELQQDVLEEVDHLFAKESEPFTTNESMLDLINKLRFQKFDSALAEAFGRLGQGDRTAEQMAAAVLTGMGRFYLDAHGVAANGNPAEMAILLQAYWNIATRRVIDNVCMTLEATFVARLLALLENRTFLLGSGPGGEAEAGGVAQLFVEDEALARRRRALADKRERLERALDFVNRAAPDVVAEPPPAVAAARRAAQQQRRGGAEAAAAAADPEVTSPESARPAAAAAAAAPAVPLSQWPMEPRPAAAGGAPMPPPPSRSAGAAAAGAAFQQQLAERAAVGGAAAFAANPDAQAAALKAAQNPEVQAAALKAAQNPEVQAAALKLAQNSEVQAAARKGVANLFGSTSSSS